MITMKVIGLFLGCTTLLTLVYTSWLLLKCRRDALNELKDH